MTYTCFKYRFIFQIYLHGFKYLSGLAPQDPEDINKIFLFSQKVKKRDSNVFQNNKEK